MLKMHEQAREDTASLMAAIGRKARAASRPLAIASTESKNAALAAMADAIERSEKAILDANAIDLANGEEAKLSPAVSLPGTPHLLVNWVESPTTPSTATALAPGAMGTARSFRCEPPSSKLDW